MHASSPRRLSYLAGALLLCFAAGAVQASEGPQPFRADSLERITEPRSGEPFLLVLWSLDCPPCHRELSHLGQLGHRLDQEALVLISTDGPEHHAQVSDTLAKHGLEAFESWAFADGFAERLRYQVDPQWYGELPRAYFYDAGHRREGVSGALSLERLERWTDERGVRGGVE